MIIYSNEKSGFIDEYKRGILIKKIEERYILYLKKHPSKGEKSSWEKSLPRLIQIIKDSSIPGDVGIAIEYELPDVDGKRIDVMISGYDEYGNANIIIIELKQWSKVDEVPDSFLVHALVGNGHEDNTNHPSRQALNYAGYISNLVEPVVNNEIHLYPCSYLHNYCLKKDDPLIDSKFNSLFKQSPVFTMDNEDKLKDFIKKYIKKGDRRKIIYDLDKGNLVPSRRLQEDIIDMIEGKQKFYLLDTQEDVYEKALYLANKALKENEKYVLIVKGGPGTGKSVVAIQLFAEFYQRKIISHYTTMNSAPRKVFFEELKNSEDQEYIRNLFTGAYSYEESKCNEIPVIIADESHRLKEKTYATGRVRGNNQIREIINASMLSIFFIDEDQIVTDNDIGTVEEIKRCCKINSVKPQNIIEEELESQFRCKGSSGYLSWIDDTLQIRKTANHVLTRKKYDFKVVDSPDELDRLIHEKNVGNSARIVSGYYKEWVSKTDNTKYDFELSETFKKKWNMEKSKPWAYRKDSLDEIGCIHTCQGLEFDYIGVIIGTDLRYENGKIVTDLTKNANSDRTSMVHIKALYKKNPEEAIIKADKIIKNTYKVLMTRGMKGCYVYCEDSNLADYIKSRIIY